MLDAPAPLPLPNGSAPPNIRTLTAAPAANNVTNPQTSTSESDTGDTTSTEDESYGMPTKNGKIHKARPAKYAEMTGKQILAYLVLEARKGNPSLTYSSMDTGVIYDVRMRYHSTLDETDLHPEDPRRIHSIYQALVEGGLIDEDATISTPDQKPDKDCMAAPDHRMNLSMFYSREATKEEVCLVHTEDHWDFLESTQCLFLQKILCTRSRESC